MNNVKCLKLKKKKNKILKNKMVYTLSLIYSYRFLITFINLIAFQFILINIFFKNLFIKRS